MPEYAPYYGNNTLTVPLTYQTGTGTTSWTLSGRLVPDRPHPPKELDELDWLRQRVSEIVDLIPA